MKINFVDLKKQYEGIKPEIDEAIKNVIDKTAFILGDELFSFEKEFAEYCGVKFAVGLDSGISSLELGMRALGIGPGDEVITPVNSFIASSSAISFCGATPVFVDCDKESYNIDVNLIETTITNKTKAIMPVHLYGQVAEMDKIIQIAQKYNLFIIEDACQAHGAKYKGKKAGSFGNFAAFSFYPGKNLGAFGDGGMLITNNEKIADSVKMMRNYGQKEKYHHETLAWNRRLDNLQAAILRVKLRYLDDWNKKRKTNAEFYEKYLKDLPIELPITKSNNEHIFHVYVIKTKRRDDLLKFLADKEISTGIHYPIPIHLQNCYKNLNYKENDFPIAEKYANQILSLPIYAELTEEEIKFICTQIKNFFVK